MGHALKDLIVGVKIIGIEDADNVTRGEGDALVHGVVDAVVGFGDYFGNVRERADCFQGGILGTAVDDDVLDGDGLGLHASQAGGDEGGAVVGGGDERKRAIHRITRSLILTAGLPA